MCGIAGILHFNSLEDANTRVLSMTNALQHRGPDASGFFHDRSISFGHRRLSIIDLSDASNQPFHDHTGRYILVFNGEIYNYSELKRELSNYPFVTSSDTEVLMAAFCTWGINCLNKLDGMFAFSVWDKVEETLWLVRDRMGVKPLYFFQDANFFLFSSEKRSILKSSLIKIEIDEQSMFEYLSFQSTGYPSAMIKGIQQVKAGTYVKVTKQSCEVKSYWDITETRSNEFEDLKQINGHVFNLLLQAVKKRKVSDVGLGVFLSGGIDSSAIVGLLSLGNDQRINTFTLASSIKEYDESNYAEQVAKRYSTSHVKVLLEPSQMLSNIMDGLNAMDSPTADGINTYLISKSIREIGLKVALSGIGGDELFLGYPGFMQYYKLNKLHSSFPFLFPLQKACAYCLSSFTAGKPSRLGRMLAVDNPSINKVYPILREILSPQQINKFIKTDITSSGLQQLLNDNLCKLEKFELFSQYSIAEYLGYSQQTLLKDTDQMSMALGLEIREPFFDYRLIEYVLSLPDKVKYTLGVKKLLVDAVYPILPNDVSNRPKQGFLLPWQRWIRNELFDLCDKHIRQFAQREFVHEKPLLNYWKRFLKNDTSIRWMELWQIVVLDFWMQKHIDSN